MLRLPLMLSPSGTFLFSLYFLFIYLFIFIYCFNVYVGFLICSLNINGWEMMIAFGFLAAARYLLKQNHKWGKKCA